MGTVKFESVDKRSMSIRFPLGGDDLDKAGTMIRQAATDGYRLESAATILSGDQRDPYSVGVTLVLVRGPQDGTARA